MKPKLKITNEDLYSALFEDVYPLYTLQLFEDQYVRHGILSKFFLPVELRPWPLPLLQDYSHSPERLRFMADVLYSPISDITPLSADIISIIIFKHHQYADAWLSGALKELPKYLDTIVSNYKWKLCKTVGFHSVFPNTDLTLLQSLWVVGHANRDQSEQVEVWYRLLETLQPWLNLELFQSIHDQKENTRHNVLYEQQHEAIMSGRQLDDEELDIIDHYSYSTET